MRSASIEDITWTSSQLEMELNKFRESLIRFQLDETEVDAGDVNSRFDILWSRLALFQQGRVGDRLAKYDRETNIVSRLFDRMKELDRRVVDLQNGDKVEAALLLAEFDTFPAELSEFSRLVTLGEETQGRIIRERLRTDVNITMFLSAMATIVALATLAYINWKSLRFERLAEKNRELAVIAEDASKAKSSFLTMMSHELRTPMNGVLGLLALSKQYDVQPQQFRLIEQAEQSAQKMVALLADILDFSALQSDEITLKSKPFEISYLAEAVKSKFEPLARREGISFDVATSSECPKRIKGDYRRLRQAFSHLTEYIVETAGAQEIQLDFSCNDGLLMMELSFEYTSEGGAWTPDLIMGEPRNDGETFATDALGPAIARGIIMAMKGRIRVDNPVGNRICVVATVPVEEVLLKELCVLVLSNSEAMDAICRAAIKGDDVVFKQQDDRKDVHIVLIEAGNQNEATFLQTATTDYPDALIVALGEPYVAEPFDFVIALPLDFKELRALVFRQIA